KFFDYCKEKLGHEKYQFLVGAAETASGLFKGGIDTIKDYGKLASSSLENVITGNASNLLDGIKQAAETYSKDCSSGQGTIKDYLDSLSNLAKDGPDKFMENISKASEAAGKLHESFSSLADTVQSGLNIHKVDKAQDKLQEAKDQVAMAKDKHEAAVAN